MLEITYVYIVISVSLVSGVPEIVISPKPVDCASTPLGNPNSWKANVPPPMEYFIGTIASPLLQTALEFIWLSVVAEEVRVINVLGHF